MKIQTATKVFAFLATCTASVASATDYYYGGGPNQWDGPYYSTTKGGSGTTVAWGENDRILLVDNQSVSINDSTIGFFDRVGSGVMIVGTNVAVNIDLQSDKAFGTYIGSFATVPKENSRIVKTGSGALSFTKTGAYKIGSQDIFAYQIGFDVKGGSVQLEPSYGAGLRHNHGDVSVATGCELVGVSGALTCLSSLSGSGTVRGVGSGPDLRITGERETPTVFSGFLTGFNVVSPVGHTYFTGTANDFTHFQPFGYKGGKTQGITGFSTFAGANGTASSFGKTSSYGIDLRNGSACLRYVGTAGETIERIVNFFANSTANAPFTVDAGEHGGLNMTGWLYNNAQVQQVVALSGDKSAAVSVFGGKVNRQKATSGKYASFRIVKKGEGTWRKIENAEDQMTGGFDVEEGTLEYVSVRDKLFSSSLGKATDLYAAQYGSPDTIETSPYAHILGGTGAEAVFSYLGTYPRTITTRPIGLAGNARIKAPNTTALRWQGITGITAGEKVLTVETMSGQTNTLADVTDGSGKVSVVHDGAGELVLTGNNGFTGDLTAKSGTLTVRNVNGQAYSWYKLTIKETVKNSSLPEYQTDPSWKTYPHVALDEFALFSSDGKRQNKYGDYRAQATAESPELLEAYRIAAVNNDLMHYYYADYRSWPGQLVNDDHNGGSVFQGYMKDTGPTVDDPTSWVSLVQRLPDSAETVTGYDLRLFNHATEARYFGSTPTAYTVCGSSDGMIWEEIASTNNMVNLPTTYYYWIGAQKYNTRTEADATLPLSRTTMKSSYAAANIRAISAAAGAKVRCEGSPIVVSNLNLDAKGGAGAIEGFSFGAAGTLYVEDAENPSGRIVIPVDLSKAVDRDNISHWNLYINGKKKNRNIVVRDSSITISPTGLIVTVR